MDENSPLRIRNLYDTHADLLDQTLFKQFLCEFAIPIVTREFSIENENSHANSREFAIKFVILHG